MDAKEKELFECIKIIVSRCIVDDKDLIKNTAKALCDNDAISSTQRKKIDKDVDEGFCSEAANSVIESVYRRDNRLWRENLFSAISDRDFPGPVTMIKLLYRMLGKEPIPEGLTYLIMMWDNIVEEEEQVLKIVNSFWPNDSLIFSGDLVVLNLILKCHMEQATDDVKKFISAVVDFLHKNFPQAKPTPESNVEMEEDKTSLEDSSSNVQGCTKFLHRTEIPRFVKLMICKTIDGDKDCINDFAIGLCDCKLIAKGDRNDIRNSVNGGNPLSAAAEDLCNRSMKKFGESWIENLLAELPTEDFPGDERLKSVLEYLCGDKPILRDIGFLMKSWDDWSQFFSQVEELMKVSWDSSVKIPVHDKTWPLIVILKCLAEEDVKIVTKFVTGIRQIMEEKGLMRDSSSQQVDSQAKKPRLDAKGDYKKTSSSVPVSDTVDELQNINIAGQGSEIKGIHELRTLHATDALEESLEFRVVLAENSSIPIGALLYMYINLYGEGTRVKLKMNNRGIFCCSIPALKTKRSFEYKYFYQTQDQSVIWETFPSDGGVRTNRYVFSQDASPGSIYQDVVSFTTRYKPWHILCHESMARHLPSMQELSLDCKENTEKIDFVKEILKWMHNIRKGWRLTGYLYSTHCLPVQEVLRLLSRWLENNHSLMKDGTKHDSIRLIISTLILVVALDREEIVVYDGDFLRKIFINLSIHKLDEDELKLLYKEIVAATTSHGDSLIPKIQDAILSLFKQLKDHPIPEFFFALPLYWLLADKGNIENVAVRRQEHGQLLFQKSGLPQGTHLKWSDIKQKFSWDLVQRDIVKLAPAINDICKLHPWILGSVQYMLKPNTLIELIMNHDTIKIGGQFSLDTVFFQLLSACKGTITLKLSELTVLDEYFIRTFQSMTEDTRSRSIEDTEDENDVKQKMEIPRNILTSFHNVLADIAKKSEYHSQNKKNNDSVLWCLNMCGLAFELANVLAKNDIHTNAPGIKKILEAIQNSICNRIHKCKVDEDQIQYWNLLMNVQWPDEKFKLKWIEVMKSEMKQMIEKEWSHNDDEFLNYYAEKLEDVHLEEPVEACFSEKAFKCTEALLSKYGGTSNKKEKGFMSFVSSNLRSVQSRFSTPRFIKIFDRLFSREVQKAKLNLPNESQDMVILRFLFVWPFAPQFFSLFNTKEALSKFSMETRDRISNAALTFESIVDSLREGHIFIKHLKMIWDHKDKYTELRYAISSKKGSHVDDDPKFLSHVLDQRWVQYQAYETAAEHIQGFLAACSKLDESGEIMVNAKELHEKILERGKVNDAALSQVSPESFLTDTSMNQKSYFNLPVDILKRFEAITMIKDSKVFHEMLYQNALNAKSEAADSEADLGDVGLWRVRWIDVVNGLWKETHRDLMTLVQEIDAGILTLDTICEWFTRCTGEPNEIKEEMRMLYNYYDAVLRKTEEAKVPPPKPQPKSDRKSSRKRPEEMSDDENSENGDSDSWNSDEEESDKSEEEMEDSEAEEYNSDSEVDSDAEEEQEDYEAVCNIGIRTRQLCSYFQLEKAKETIDVLLQVKDELSLEGDFSSIENQKKQVRNKELTLNVLPDSQDVPFVCKIPQVDVDCLRQFIKEKELIVWLKEKMSDISEVKVMCDLAMISAGETPYEVDIVSCLLSAVMGFAPLIFELDTSADLKKLLEKCKIVWKNRDTDENLVKKWKDTGTQLTWFQGIENFHGSVEKQSLTLAQEINKRGIYTIKRWNFNGALTPRDCINLTLPDKSEIGQKDTYRLDDLCDLQSRLMLIAGEAEMGQTDAANFVDVLNAIQILAGTFVKLVSTGCMLFNSWSAVITCMDISSDATNNLLIQVKFSDDLQALSGTGSLADLSKLSTILNQSLERWNSHISAKRMEHYFLNEYSIQQMIYLCHELAMCKDKLPDQVDTLLSIVASYLDMDVLHELIDEATKVQDDEPMEQDVENQDIEMEGDDGAAAEPRGEVNDTEAKNRAVRYLIDKEGLEEDVAKASVQENGIKDLDECVTWSLINQYEEEMIQNLCEQFNKDAGHSHQEKELRVINSILHDRSQNTLKEVIDRLQDGMHRNSSVALMDSIHTVCSGYHDETKVITLQDSLSIEHLGRFLHLLHEEAKLPPLGRDLMDPFRKGRPNLLLCQEQEILPSVLRLYMHNEDQPLPTPSEVLVCSQFTTIDEIERFMRRAMCKCDKTGSRLFSLAFADKLSFNVSTTTEKIFNQLSQETKNEEYQLVILLSRQQHYLTTCFDKYLIEGKWITVNADIPRYLEKHLKVKGNLNNSAAIVDESNSMVKIVSSARSGVGKSLHVRRLSEMLSANFDPMLLQWRHITIRLLERTLDLDYVIERLYRSFGRNSRNSDTMLIHIDLTPAVHTGIDVFAFNLFVLGSIQDSEGKVWKRHPRHLYMLEMTDAGFQGKGRFPPRHILNLLPSVKCYAPREILENPSREDGHEWLGMDLAEFRSETFQRPFQYLALYDEGRQQRNLDSFRYSQPQGTPEECIHTLLKHCCMSNPSWAQLRHFASFLNVQLQNCENSVFCDQNLVGQELQGLKAFAVQFMIRMSQDFATPSLNISDESSAEVDSPVESTEEDLQIYQFRRKWEESTHPYLFFNEDRVTMTFINVNLSEDGDLLDKNGEIVEGGVISKQLVHGLMLQGVSLDLNFDTFDRQRKLGILCQVMGIEDSFDPDPTYELTTDNVLKILAIYMRFRCEIPVIIMGETGCGKTRMVEFMSKLKSGRRNKEVQSMITLKIHGGINVSDIHRSVREAQRIAAQNKEEYNLSTTLFYDEANTTEAIYAIKEVMCDLTIDGSSFKESQLKLVAACNPYKQLSKEAIRKLEDSGLGYRIRTSDTAYLFGNIPMRTLVYRVVALPPSMQPFVWDFGQLSDEAEKMYIQQMTKKLGRELDLDRETLRLINAVLSEAQNYMRSRQDECRYVSLRDVERCVITYEWFYKRKDFLYRLIEHEVKHRYDRMNRENPDMTETLRTLLQTIGVCYHASLDDRLQFRKQISYAFGLEGIHVTELMIREEISAAQAVFLRNMKMEDNIAANEALQENVFMMTVCADMRIPLFLIGKPGSSKSLAKTIVGDNMQGNTSRSSLYKKLKQVHILSYQCSALTDAVGIESVFKQCAQLQAKQDLNSYTAVVVLDEIGLAEDSPNMPLKVLHPLLECGSTANSSLTEFDVTRKVGFVGISNWALDPAKMNRGIFVTRNKPSKDDLKKTAKGIFQNQKNKINENLELLEKLTESYMRVYENQQVEYFGLRDYYSLIKMVHSVCTASKEARLTAEDVTNAIHRNFSGGKRSNFEDFRRNIQHLFRDVLMSAVPIRQMISDNLQERDSRFLLLLTNQFSAASLLHLCMEDFESQAQTVFGSSFPGDHNYTDICRNINRIKVCMETGRTVVLLNMTEIHESLYDALNQHYVTFGGQRYVDLGLGGHRVKCRIADAFRLIVVEQKEVVYSEYPIPLINRLEKHHLDSKSLLSPDQRLAADSLTEWTDKFSDIRGKDFSSKDAFVGYHDDTVSSVVLTTSTTDQNVQIGVLLQSSTMDAIFRLPESDLGGQTEAVQEAYLSEQHHDSLAVLLKERLKLDESSLLLEITSFSNILSESDRKQLETELQLLKNGVMLLSLEQFETEQEYANKIDEFFKYCSQTKNPDEARILMIQCSQAQSRGQLISCAKYCLLNKMKEFFSKRRSKVIVALLMSTEREGGAQTLRGSLLLQHSRDNQIIYIDELRPTSSDIAPASHFYKRSLCDILQMGAKELECERQEGSLINVISLLRDCICEALAKVKSRLSESKRYFDRVKLLSSLFDEENTTGSHFRKILVQKMIQLYDERQEQMFNVEKDWIVAEACNRESLQEGGTFRKTLWLCLKRHISRLIAFMISVTDRHNNLDLLLFAGAAWKVDMWLKVFQSMTLSWNTVGGAEQFLITAPRHHKSTVPCKVPFSFLLHEFFISQWDTLTQQNSVDLQEIFFQLFRDSPLFQIVSRATADAKVKNMMKLYASDLLHSVYIPGTSLPAEIEVMENILHEFAMKQFAVWRQTPEFKTGDEVLIVFLTYKQQSVYLNLISEMFRSCPELIEKTQVWIEEQKKQQNFIVHISAFESMLKLTEETAEGLSDPETCLEWGLLMTSVKRIFNKLINYINDQERMNRILKKWTPLTLVNLLVEHLLPSKNSTEVFENYLSIIAPQAKLMWRGSFEKDIRSHDTLRIMCNVLKRSYDAVRLKLKVNWHDQICKLCRKRVQDPTFLPCGHFTCEQCIRRLVVAAETGRRCPICTVQVPVDYIPQPSVLNKIEEEELENFRSNCTSFFLEYLRQFCFASLEKTQLSMMENQVKSLIAEMVVQAPDLERNELANVAIDLNINSKAAILRILLNSYPELTKNELNEWMKKLNRPYLKTLTNVIIKCFEDQILLNMNMTRGGRVEILDRWEKKLGAAWRTILTKGEILTKFEILQLVSEMRCCLTEATSCINDIFRKKQLEDDVTAKADDFVSFAVRICYNTEEAGSILQEFIVKTACRNYGSDWFHLMKENDIFEHLVPITLYEAREADKPDSWPIVGKSYTDQKSRLYKTPPADIPGMANEVLRPDNPEVRLGRILALLTWCYSKDNDTKAVITEQFQRHADSKTLFFTFLSKVHSEFLPTLKATGALNEPQQYIIYQLVTVVVAMVTSRSHMMDGFLHMMTRPSIVARMFLPAMPESPFFSVPADMRRQGYNMLYTCPNGHVYAIGECTQPMQTAKCADCGATIGGSGHRSAAGNQRYALQNEDTQRGYLLRSRGNNVVDPADRVSKQGAAVLQFILHTCMLLGLDKEERVVLQMVGQGTKLKGREYLLRQLQDNLQAISSALDRNMDETVMIMHEIVLRLLNQREGPLPPDWSTLDKRHQWEDMFRERYLLPIFQNLDTVIQEAQEKINSAEDKCSMILYRLVHEVPPHSEPNYRNFGWKDSMLWMYIKHSNSNNLLQYLGDGPDVKEGVLKIILESPDLHYIKYLEPVLQLQATLIQKYQNEADMNDTERINFKQFEKEGGHSHRELMDKYIEIWNMVFRNLKAKLQFETRLREYFMPISMHSPISMGLPSTRGRGQCAKILAEYLIDLQNEFLNKCKQVMKGDESIEEAEVSQLFHSHYVCLDRDEDLLPLIHIHTKYDIDVDKNGRHHRIYYNINALEKQVRENFIMFKKLIAKQSLPTIKYPQDIGIGSDWDSVLANAPQQPLSAKLAQDVDRIVSRVTSADVCEGVRTLTHAVSFLAKVKSNPKKYLIEFLEKDLLLSPSRTTVIPKSVMIQHTLSLYNRLSWHKAVHFASRGLNPYKDALATTEQTKITNRDILKTLKEVFEHSDVILLQQRMNEILIKNPDFNGDWSLSEIFPYFEFIGDDGEDDSWYARLPDDILFKHVTHLFTLAVNFTTRGG